jgi:putative aldouronate transport system substrate-binding protein
MKKSFQSSLALLVIMLMVVSIIAACASKTEEKKVTGSTKPAESVSKDPIKLKLWTPMNGNASAVVKNLGEVQMVQEWQKKTNVIFDFQHPTVTSNADISQQFGVMIASNDLPDVMVWNFNGNISKMFNDGNIIKLNDLIDKYAPNLKKILADNPDVAKQIKADNGDIYAIPHLRYGEYGKYKTFSGLMIRQDWLDEFGLKFPETMDEWEVVLKTIKEKKGITPFTLNKDVLIGSSGSNDFLGAYGIGKDFYVDNGKIKYGPLQPEFKQYLDRMQQWYKAGLIDSDYATNDVKTMNAKITSGKSAAFYGFIGGTIGTLLPALQESDPKAMIAAVQYPVLVKGDQPKFTVSNWDFDGIGAVITKVNKHPEETIKALDFLFSKEGSMLKNFGIEGQTYTMVNGQPQYTDLILKNPDNLPIGQAMGKYFIANYSFAGPDDDRYNDQYYNLQTQKDAVKTYSEYSNNAYKVMVPPITLTIEEATEFGKITADVGTYRNEITTKIMLGSETIANYDKAIDQFKKMNIDRAIEIQQAALDRYNKR